MNWPRKLAFAALGLLVLGLWRPLRAQLDDAPFFIAMLVLMGGGWWLLDRCFPEPKLDRSARPGKHRPPARGGGDDVDG